jgi:hypothetical protein
MDLAELLAVGHFVADYLLEELVVVVLEPEVRLWEPSKYSIDTLGMFVAVGTKN